MRILITISLLFTLQINAQVVFKKTYGSSGYEHAERVVQLYDTGYAIVGASALTGYSSDVYLLRLDSLGNYLWSQFYGGPNVDYGYDLVVTPDSGFAICGHTNSTGYGGYDVYLIKTDKNGVLEWEKTYGGSDWDLSYGIELLPDSGFAIVGETYSFGNGNNDIYVIRTDKNGDVIWEKTLGSSQHEEGKDLLLTANEELIILGNTDNTVSGNYDVFAARMDLNGDTLWTRTYGDSLDDFGSRIKAVYNYYNIIGSTANTKFGKMDIILLGLLANGDTAYTQKLGTPEDDFGYDLDERTGLNTTMFAAFDLNMALDGLPNWGMYYMGYQGVFLHSVTTGEVNHPDHVSSVASTFDDAAILVGNTQSYSIGIQDILVVKLGPHPTFNLAPNVNSQFQDFTDVSYEPVQVSLNVYPNPAEDIIRIDWPGKSTDVFIYDLSGKMVLQKPIQNGILNVSDLAPSLYILEVTDGEYSGRCKITIR